MQHLQEFIKHISQDTNRVKNPKILDLGCGLGLKSLELYKARVFTNPTFFLVDSYKYFMDPMLDIYTDHQENFSNSGEVFIEPGTFKTIILDELKFLMKLDFDEKFDVIISSMHIHFFPLDEQKHFLRLMKESLNKNGLIYLCLRNKEKEYSDGLTRYLFSDELEKYLNIEFSVVNLKSNNSKKQMILHLK